MDRGEKYWAVIDPYWHAINIDSPEVFESTFNQVPRSVGLLYAAHFCQSEVCNGGFTQFFWNSTGVLGPEAVEGFKAIGQQKVADVVRRAMHLLSDPYARSRTDPWRALERLAEGTRDRSPCPADHSIYKRVKCFGPMEDEFYGLIDSEAGGFEAAAERYAELIERND
jgi:hypothetical protein